MLRAISTTERSRHQTSKKRGRSLQQVAPSSLCCHLKPSTSFAPALPARHANPHSQHPLHQILVGASPAPTLPTISSSIYLPALPSSTTTAATSSLSPSIGSDSTRLTFATIRRAFSPSKDFGSALRLRASLNFVGRNSRFLVAATLLQAPAHQHSTLFLYSPTF